MGRFPQLSRACQQRICSQRARARCLLPTSAADFCCHEHPMDPQLPSLRLAPLCPPRPARRPHRRLRASEDAQLSTATPDSRCRHLRPWVATQLTLRPPVVATFIVPRKALGCPSIDPRWHCGPNASPMRRPPTLPVTAPSPSGCPSESATARTCFPSTSPKVLVVQIQSAFRR